MKKKLAIVWFCAVLALALTACGDRTGYPKDGQALGEIGDTMHTAFFDFTVNSAQLADSFDGYTPAEGYELLVADITIKNNSGIAQPMGLWDFQVQWNSLDGENPDDAFDYAVHEGEGDDLSAYTGVSEQQLPTIYELQDDEERQGILLYQVPEGRESFSISFQEYFDDDTTGDVFFVEFTL